jgi:hypothetical protein
MFSSRMPIFGHLALANQSPSATSMRLMMRPKCGGRSSGKTDSIDERCLKRPAVASAA